MGEEDVVNKKQEALGVLGQRSQAHDRARRPRAGARAHDTQAVTASVGSQWGCSRQV